ncbi:MAG: fatty acid CoA ligase FadD9, partial [Pseudonocardiales bacterium]|nr:fatty acid CoA ligase FadD9 [Pseudonocardiales bacterium]
LSQGDFVAVARLEAIFATSPLVHQIFVYGSGEQSYLLAVVVADTTVLDGTSAGAPDEAGLRAAVLASLRECAEREGLRSWETPRDVLIEGEPFSTANGLLSGIGKLRRPALTARYGPRLEELYADGATRRAELAGRLRDERDRRPVLEIVLEAARLAAGSEGAPAEATWSFADLGGDSLSAHTFSMLLTSVFDVEVPIRLIIGPTATLADVAGHLAATRAEPSRRPSFESVHSPGADRVSAKDLQLEAFFDDALLAAAADLAPARTDIGTVLVTGATGYLGRFVLLDLLERAAATGGRVVCVARGTDAADARRRVLDSFGDPAAELGQRVAELATGLDVLAGDVASSRLGLADAQWQRVCDDVDLVVHSAALVNHVLPYPQLFDSNVLGTAEIVRLALTGRRKRVAYVSSVAAAMRADGTIVDEHADVRIDTGERVLNEDYANGYATTKWAGEVLLREAHDRFGVPVTVFRPDMILAHTRWAGQLNVADRFTRLLLSVVATGLAPGSFYRGSPDGARARAHYSGLPVDFTAAAIVALAVESATGYRVYNTLNANDDGLSLDDFVDWLIDAGVEITRIEDFGQWRDRFETVLRSLSPNRRAASVLPLMHAYAEPADPRVGRALPNECFAAGVRRLGVATGTVPSISPALIGKYVRDLASLDLV